MANRGPAKGMGMKNVGMKPNPPKPPNGEKPNGENMGVGATTTVVLFVTVLGFDKACVAMGSS